MIECSCHRPGCNHRLRLRVSHRLRPSPRMSFGESPRRRPSGKLQLLKKETIPVMVGAARRERSTRQRRVKHWDALGLKPPPVFQAVASPSARFVLIEGGPKKNFHRRLRGLTCEQSADRSAPYCILHILRQLPRLHESFPSSLRCISCRGAIPVSRQKRYGVAIPLVKCSDSCDEMSRLRHRRQRCWPVSHRGSPNTHSCPSMHKCATLLMKGQASYMVDAASGETASSSAPPRPTEAAIRLANE